MFKPWSFATMVINAEAATVMCWSLMFNGIFTGGILKVRFCSLARDRRYADGESQSEGDETTPQKIMLGQTPPPNQHGRLACPMVRYPYQEERR